MSTEQLTAEQSLKIYKIRASVMGGSVSADEADGFIAGYRAAMNEVEQQTKQLKELNETLVSANTEANMKIDQLREERVGLMKDINTAFELLNHVHTFYTLADPLEKEVSNFLTQLNQNNEG